MSKLFIVGLQNHGMGTTRHSVGAAFIEYLAVTLEAALTNDRNSQCDLAEVPAHGLVLARPRTFMNLSGRLVQKLLASRHGSVDRLLIVHDDLDLPVGKWGLKNGGSARGHNGVRSVCDSLKTQDFARLRVGIGRPHSKEDVPSYVLGRFTNEHSVLLKGVAFPAMQTAIQARASSFISTRSTVAPLGDVAVVDVSQVEVGPRLAGRKRSFSESAPTFEQLDT